MFMNKSEQSFRLLQVYRFPPFLVHMNRALNEYKSAVLKLLLDHAGGGDPVPEFCDQFLPATDIPGANLGALGGTADNAACLAACQTTAGCNAAIRVDSNGACFFKSVDFNAITPVSVPGLTSYVDCTPGVLQSHEFSGHCPETFFV